MYHLLTKSQTKYMRLMRKFFVSGSAVTMGKMLNIKLQGWNERETNFLSNCTEEDKRLGVVVLTVRRGDGTAMTTVHHRFVTDQRNEIVNECGLDNSAQDYALLFKAFGSNFNMFLALDQKRLPMGSVSIALYPQMAQWSMFYVKDCFLGHRLGSTLAQPSVELPGSLHVFCYGAADMWFKYADDYKLLSFDRLQMVGVDRTAYLQTAIRLPQNAAKPWLPWHVDSELYPHKCYPPFVQGSSFVISRAAAAEVLRHVCAFHGFAIHLDDILMGLLTNCLGISNIHRDGFNVGHSLDSFTVLNYQFSRYSSFALSKIWQGPSHLMTDPSIYQ